MTLLEPRFLALLFNPLRDSVMPSDHGANLAVSMALSSIVFVVVLLIGKPFITYLRRNNVGKQIRIEEPEGHSTKTGTPTMGGLMVTVPVIALTLIFNLAGRLSMLLPLGVLIGTAMGGMETIEREIETLNSRGPGRVSPFFVPMYLADMASGYVSIILGAQGPNLSTLSASRTSDHSNSLTSVPL
jgi:UDP-N-acetylmuramyl pentapeptide phosphotransferase/UDP-N-acetylglucosamine-1-phosphate transferase